MQVGIVATRAQVAEARVLADSLRRFHPDWPVAAVFVGGTPVEASAEEPFQPVEWDDLGPEVARLSLRTPVGRLLPVARALLARLLLERSPAHVLVVDADSEATGPLTELEAAVEDHRAVLVPRVLGQLPHDGNEPSAIDLLARGQVDEGLIALRNEEGAGELCSWWVDRGLEPALGPEGGDPAHPETKAAAVLAGAMPRVFPGTGTLEHAGYAISYWNLHERPLERSGDELTTLGVPVRLVRFEGFRPDRPWWLSEHGSRVLVLDDALLSELCGRRSVALREAGWVPPHARDETARPDSVEGDPRLRRLHLEGLEAGEHFGDVDSADGRDRLLAWLAEPAPYGADAGVNRYAYDAWLERSDLQSAYPDLDGADGPGFVGWLWVHGRAELELDGHLLPAAPDWIGNLDAGIPAVEVVGYLRGNLGLGQAARGYVTALTATGIPVATRTVSTDTPAPGTPAPRVEREYEDLALPPGTEPEANLLCVNADQVPGLAEDLGVDVLRSRYTIGQWAWETDEIPARWDPSFELVDEVWVYSTYVADNLSRASPVPVVVVPLPIIRPEVDPSALDLPVPDGAFVFLFAFDYLSTLQRKNPGAVVEAFTAAFEPGEGPLLVLKTINADLRPEARERLRWLTAGRDDVLLLDETVSEPAMQALLARADCYVSLHRSEGFGLPLAESMSLGKPVVATRFGGNTDFMTPVNSFLVDWEPTPVGPDAEHYPSGGTWAEPSVGHAAELLRRVWDDPEEARRRGVRAAADIAARLSPDAVGAIARARLQRVWARRGEDSNETVPAPLGEVEERLRFDLRGTGGGVRGVARRGLMRALRPYTSWERSLDEATVDALRRLHGDLDAERAARERDRARVSALEKTVHELAQRADAADHERARLAGELATATAGLEPLLAAAHAIPHTSGDPFATFDHPIAGRVLGFRDADEAGRDDEAYRRFEDVFRGPRERVAELVAPYIDLLRDHGPVLDVGCGRGELIESLTGAGIAARGVDLDAGMAEVASSRGLDVVVGDGVEHLARAEAGSLGAITAMHVIEHLPFDRLQAMLRAAVAALRPGGLLIAETVNPHAGFALKTFWVDPTHQHPLFPEVMLALAGASGFPSAFIAHMRGTQDVDVDRFQQDSYAVVAQR